MVYALAALTGAVSVTNWYAVARAQHRWEWWTKLLTMVALMAKVATAGATGVVAWEPPVTWLLVALTFGLVGDFALLGETEGRFVRGVAAFLVGHLAYLVCFAALGLPSPAWAWAGLVVLAGITWASRRVTPTAYRLSGLAVAVPLAVYSLVIGAMLLLAWLTGLWLVAAGATVFVVSDTIIGLTLEQRRYGRATGRSHVAVMVTYHCGGFLIALGVLRALG